MQTFNSLSTGGQVFCAIVVILGILAAFLGLAALNIWVVVLLWNFVVPGLFAGPAITFWQAGALMTLIGFLGGCTRFVVNRK
jgi:hypothetical protein